jgi:cell division protein FtsW
VVRSIEAFVRGKWFGVGIGMSEIKLTGLPYPFTDSIFAVIAEETGLAGATVLVGLYLAFLWRGLTIAQRAPDELGRLLAGGLSIWIATEAFINMAVMLNILPFAGNALPFISKGGSNLLFTFAAVGVVLNISRASVQSEEQEGSTLSEVVNLRWRNGRRRVSRSRRSESSRSVV